MLAADDPLMQLPALPSTSTLALSLPQPDGGNEQARGRGQTPGRPSGNQRPPKVKNIKASWLKIPEKSTKGMSKGFLLDCDSGYGSMYVCIYEFEYIYIYILLK